MERLLAAYQAAGLTWQRLAKKARVSHATISRLRSRRTKTVNAKTLSQLANALQVPVEWLMGEQQGLPYVPEWGPGKKKGRQPSLWERPTADSVRFSWLMQRIERAVRRDLSEWFHDKGHDAYESWGRWLPTVFSEMSSAIAWRTTMLDPGSRGSWYEVMTSDDSTSMAWLEHVLEPWLAGTAYLNPDGGLRDVFAGLLSNPGRLWGSEIRDADALRALHSYATAMKEHAPPDEPPPADE